MSTYGPHAYLKVKELLDWLDSPHAAVGTSMRNDIKEELASRIDDAQTLLNTLSYQYTQLNNHLTALSEKVGKGGYEITSSGVTKTIRNILVNEHGLTTDGLKSVVLETIDAQVAKQLKSNDLATLIKEQVKLTLNAMAKDGHYDASAIRSIAAKAAADLCKENLQIGWKDTVKASAPEVPVAPFTARQFNYTVNTEPQKCDQTWYETLQELYTWSPGGIDLQDIADNLEVLDVGASTVYFGMVAVKRVK